MEKSDIQWRSLSDLAIFSIIANFVKHHRLQQNKTQSELAKEAGINRSTLHELEHGKPTNALTLIQLLRALNQLSVIESFQINTQPSPLMLAQLAQKKNKRAVKPKSTTLKAKADW